MTVHIRALLLLSASALTASPLNGQIPMPLRDVRPGVQQPQPVGTAVITGTVTMAASGQPARRVRVNVSSSELRGTRTATTDDQGRFSFTALPAGRYTLSASKPGHLAVTYGQRTPGRAGTPIQLSDGQKFHADLRIPKGSVLTGTILDEHGEPAPQVSVRASRVAMQNGARTLIGANSGSTDDRGIYRLFGLMPGEYLVCATPRNTVVNDADRARIELQALQRSVDAVVRANPAQEAAIRERIASLEASVAQSNSDETAPVGYAPVCYPGTISSTGGSTVMVGVGEERSAVDFQLQLAPMARVEGTVVNSTGAQIREIQVRLTELNALGSSLPTPTARAGADGRFVLSNVPPGQYRVTARGAVTPPRPAAAPTPPAGRTTTMQPRAEPINLWASADIVVDGRNVSNVMLPLQQGVALSGQIRFEGSATPPPDLTRLRITMMSAEPTPVAGTAAGRVDASGRFTIPSVTPGLYRVSASGAAGWFVESAIIGGQDALDLPVEVKATQSPGPMVVTFTDQQAELSGTMTNEKGEPAIEHTLVVFAADQRFWTRNARRIQSARPATDGRFTLRNLPPGEYLLASVLDLEPGALYDTAFLQQLSTSAMRISVQPGEKKVQDLRVR